MHSKIIIKQADPIRIDTQDNLAFDDVIGVEVIVHQTVARIFVV